MSEEKSDSILPAILILVGVFVIIGGTVLFVIMQTNEECQSIKDNMKQTTGKITTFCGGDGVNPHGDCIVYEFEVKGKKYSGSFDYSNNYGKLENFKVAGFPQKFSQNLRISGNCLLAVG